MVTRWYRPPELLLGERKYNTPVDMWGVGYVVFPLYFPRAYSDAACTDASSLRCTRRRQSFPDLLISIKLNEFSRASSFATSSDVR